MVLVGTVTGQSISKNLDGDLNVRLLQVEITDEDTQEIQAVYFGGEDNAPPEGATVYILQVSSAFKIVIGVDDGIEPTIDAGERKIYSQASGVIKAFSHYKKDGEINNQNDNGFYDLKSTGQLELNGAGDFAIRFAAMNTAFNLLKTELNALVTAYNLHGHPTAPSGPVSVPDTPGVPAAAVMTAAKVNNVEVSP